ncbi:MAG: preprotein translocase subunit YajC [Clostridia bacterium]|nr:preprotein translocase subunit YajC [Clostridia bacterium]
MIATLALATQYWMYIAIGVVLVVMIVLTIIPQKKRQKEQKQMMDSIQVGTKIMTIGRMVGKITQVNADNTLIVNVGTENSPTLIVIDRQAVGLVLENVAVAAPAVTETAPAEEPVAEEAPVEEAVVEEKAEVAEEATEEKAKDEEVF